MDRAAIRQLEHAPFVAAEVLDAGRGLAARAAAAAPKRTGAGAASIQPYPSATPDAVDVSWSQRHFYLIFHEDGTRYLPAQHFLLDAFESYIHT